MSPAEGLLVSAAPGRLHAGADVAAAGARRASGGREGGGAPLLPAARAWRGAEGRLAWGGCN